MSIELLTRSEVCEMLGVSVSWLTKMTAAGKGPRRTMLGGKVRFLRAEVEAWVKEQQRAPECAPATAAKKGRPAVHARKVKEPVVAPAPKTHTVELSAEEMKILAAIRASAKIG